jgi:hypothetical protein
MSATAFYVDMSLRLEGVTALTPPQLTALVQARASHGRSTPCPSG